jgi:hypothetical protein
MARMQVGVNYPWLNYGWDFGLGPPVWRGARTTPYWYDLIDRHLRHFHDLGIEVVRWFVLADGLTYGTGSAAPREEPPGSGRWRFHPLPLPAEVSVHFEELLVRIGELNRQMTPPIRLLPVFMDYKFCFPGERVLSDDPDWVKQGRADAVVDVNKRGRFLDEALEPLLRIAQRHREAIYAWEAINEPDWITNGWHIDRRHDHPADEPVMQAFLTECKDRIRRAGFTPTIGFCLIETLRKSGITAEINQFHHYALGRRRLEPHMFAPEFPGIIGEFATAETDRWPDLPHGNQSVLARLKLIAARNYPLALPWSFNQRDTHTSWTENVEHQLRTFKAERAALT